MYAIIESCGKQYKVSEGDVVFFEKLDAEEGKKVTFDKVVLVSDEGKVQVGNPYVKGVKVIEIYDAANKELLVKYDDKHNIDKVISALNIKSWKETEKSIGMNPKYTIKFYCDTTNQDEEKDIKEITLYENGEYATIFITSPGGVKQNYKTSIDISELVI